MKQWSEMGREILVSQDTSESSASFAQRVLLSIGSAWMLTALYANNGQTSVERLKHTAFDKMTLLKSTDQSLDDINIEDCSECIYETLLANGMLLHTPMYGRPAPRKLIGGSPAILRGMRPEEPCMFSGLAPIIMTDHTGETIREAFALPDYKQEHIIALLWKRGVPVRDFVPDECFMASNGGHWRRYETESRVEDDIWFGRTLHSPNQYDYYIGQGQHIKRISEDMREACLHDYLLMILIQKAGRNRIEARFGNCLVYLSLGFLLRPEMRFLRLICWPESLNELKTSRRYSVHTALWPVVRERLNILNYKVEEVRL